MHYITGVNDVPKTSDSLHQSIFEHIIQIRTNQCVEEYSNRLKSQHQFACGTGRISLHDFVETIKVHSCRVLKMLRPNVTLTLRFYSLRLCAVSIFDKMRTIPITGPIFK